MKTLLISVGGIVAATAATATIAVIRHSRHHVSALGVSYTEQEWAAVKNWPALI